ncbi:MAG: ECF transporter S component [Candidatus Thorarchaeota archaeon]
MTEIKTSIKKESFNGYFLLNNAIVLSTAAVFAAFTCILTFIVPFTIPTTGGYINLGDIGVMISGLLFGPIVGGLAGGIGSAFTDLFLAPVYAIPTLIIKGLEGFIVGLIADPKRFYNKYNYRDVLAVIAGGVFMVFGYFFTEILFYGIPSALFELFFNGGIQFGLGALVSSLFIIFARKNIISALPQVFDKIFIYNVITMNSE